MSHSRRKISIPRLFCLAAVVFAALIGSSLWRVPSASGRNSGAPRNPGARANDAIHTSSPTLIYTDNVNVFSAGAPGCCPCFCPGTPMTPGSVTYHVPRSFFITGLTVDNDDFSGNNHTGLGVIRAQVLDLDDNLVASSTNGLYGESGTHDFTFAFEGQFVAQDFKLRLVIADGLQAAASFTIYRMRFFEDVTPVLKQLTQLNPDTGGPVPEGAQTIGNPIAFDGVVKGFPFQSKLQVEVRPFGEAFTGAPVVETQLAAPGTNVSVAAPVLPDGQYHWQARTVDSDGNASQWQEFGGAGNVDFVIKATPTFPQVYADTITVFRGDNPFVSGCCPNFVLSPEQITYHLPAGFLINELTVDNDDFSGNNRAGFGNFRAWIFDADGNAIASSTNALWGQFGLHDFNFHFGGQPVPKDFKVSFVGEDILQGRTSFTVRNLRFAGDPSPTPATGCAAAPSDLVGWWPGDGNANDKSGNGNNGTAQNGLTYSNGKVQQAFNLDGTDDFVNVPDSSSFDAITSAVSVEAWIKPDVPPASRGFVFARRDPNVSESFSLVIYGDGKIGVNLRTTGIHPNGSIWVSSPGVIQFGQWQHVAATFAAATGQLNVYVNGQGRALSVMEGPSTFSGNLADVHNLFIGRRQDLNDIGGIEGEFGASYYKGLIDELSLYGRALSVSEIQAIYNAGGAGRCRAGSSPRPSASFSFSPAAPAVGQAVQFTDSSAGSSLKWSWDFDGNGFEDSASQNPSHAFAAPGPYKVTLKVTNAYGASSVTHTVNVGGATIGPGVPFVTGVTRQYPGFFFGGTDLPNRFDVDVNWNGSPGTVKFSINGGQPAVENGAPFGVSHTFNMGRDFPAKLSASTITITPVNASGNVGPTWTEHVFVSPLPSWASGPANWVLSKGELKFSVPFEVAVPHWEAKRKVPGNIRYISGEVGVQETFFKGDFAISSNGYGSLSGFGQTGFTIKRPNGVEYSLDGSLGATLEGRWDGPKGVQITKGSVRLKIKGTIAQEEGIIDVIPQLSAFSGFPVVKEFNNKAKLRFEFSPSFDGSFAFYQKGQGWGFSDSEGTLGAKPSVTLRVPLIKNHLEARAWAAGNAEMTFGTPGTFFRRGNLGIQLGAALVVNAFWKVLQFCPSATYNFGCTYTGGEGWDCTPGTGSTSEDCPGSSFSAVRGGAYPLEMIRPNYTRFGARSQFKAEPLVKHTGTKVPRSVSETQFLSNIFQGATPNMAGSGTGRMLLWVSQDESLPVLQSTDVSWSYYDGANWTTPAPLAHDTRAELAPVSGVAPDGKIVAAWVRIKDPEFTTPVNTTDDLPLFYKKLEVVSAVFDPASKTWGPVTQLTDDDSFDTDVHISSDGSGNLLLTWLSNEGGLFTSDAAHPSALKYAFWNGSGWSAPAVVSGSLAGVSGHAAALRGSNAFVVLPRDPDADAADDGVLDLYMWDGTAWNGPASFATGGVENRLPSAVYDASGEGHVVWLRGDDLVHATLGNHTPHVVRAGSESMAFYSTQMLVNPQGNLTLTWQESVDNGPANVFATLYDTASQTWSADRRLTESPQEAHDVSGFYDADGQLHLAYLSTAIERVPKDATLDDGSTITIQNVPQDGRTDLILLDHSLIVDLAVGDEDITVSPRAPLPNDSVEASITVHNAGDFAVGTFAVNLYAGDPDSGGVLVGSATVAGPLAAGEQRIANLFFVYPQAAGNLVAVVDAAGAIAEFSEENNRATSYVTNRPPEAVAVADNTAGAPPFAVNFDASTSADPDGDAVSYLWTFGDGGPNESGAQVSHSFTQTGLYPVTLTVTDSHGAVGSATVSVNVGCVPLSFSPSAFAGGRVGAPYGQTIFVTGGAQPYQFAVTAGELPEGLTLQPSGELAGTPTAAGTSLFTVSATYANGCESSADYSIKVEPASADVSITKTASVNPAEVGRIFTYNIAVSNAGPSAAVGVAVTDALTGGVTFTSAVPSQGSCTYASGTLTCRLGTLAANGSASIALQVKPRQTGTLVNTASIASETDTNNSNNHATSSINVIKTADVKVAMSDSPDPIFVGEQVTYTMLVTNLGPLNTATGVAVTDSLPAGMKFVSAATTQGSLVTPPVGSAGIVTANLGPLAVGAQATVTVTAKAIQFGTISNGASVFLNETDTNTANNTATQMTTVKAAALQKILLVKQVLAGGCENTTGNVYLTGPAPPGGVDFPLSSNVTGASVPASVFIPAGQTVSPAFNVTTSFVAVKQVGLITAGSGAGLVSRGITINVGSGFCQ